MDFQYTSVQEKTDIKSIPHSLVHVQIGQCVAGGSLTLNFLVSNKKRNVLITRNTQLCFHGIFLSQDPYSSQNGGPSTVPPTAFQHQYEAVPVHSEDRARSIASSQLSHPEHISPCVCTVHRLSTATATISTHSPLGIPSSSNMAELMEKVSKHLEEAVCRSQLTLARQRHSFISKYF